jgi:hypothetical protein
MTGYLTSLRHSLWIARHSSRLSVSLDSELRVRDSHIAQ